MNATEKSRRLRELIWAHETLVMPDAFDPLSARIIEYLGFPAVQCSGFSMALSALRPTEADLGMDANLELTRAIVGAVGVPVMADGEDGFGGAEVVAETVRAYVEAGVAGINLEDQVLGQPGPKRIVARELMIEKLMFNEYLPLNTAFPATRISAPCWAWPNHAARSSLPASMPATLMTRPAKSMHSSRRSNGSSNC